MEVVVVTVVVAVPPAVGRRGWRSHRADAMQTLRVDCIWSDVNAALRVAGGNGVGEAEDTRIAAAHSHRIGHKSGRREDGAAKRKAISAASLDVDRGTACGHRAVSQCCSGALALCGRRDLLRAETVSNLEVAISHAVDAGG